jgi:hypothetical protein
MNTPFTRLRAVPERQRLLLIRRGPIPVPGRLTTGGTIDHVAGRPAHDKRDPEDGDDDNFNADGSRRKDHERKPRYEVELLCRTFPGDTGLRPLVNIVFWESPDIWIEGPSGDPDVATPGVLNKVKVHIWNLGLADCWAAHVDLYWCNPSVGVNPTVANPIGSTVVPLAAGQHKVVSFDWVPTVVNDGHECLVAQVYDPVSDPVVAPFNPVQDRHCGQRNISVVPQPPGSELRFEFFTQNLGWTTATTELEIQKLEGDALQTVTLALGRSSWSPAGALGFNLSQARKIDVPANPNARALATGVFRETLQKTPGPHEAHRVMGVLRSLTAPTKQDAVHPREMAVPMVHPGATPAETAPAIPIVVGPVIPGIGRPAKPRRVTLPPSSHFQLTFATQVPREALRGSGDVFRIVERTAGQITGGITIVVLTK